MPFCGIELKTLGVRLSVYNCGINKANPAWAVALIITLVATTKLQPIKKASPQRIAFFNLKLAL